MPDWVAIPGLAKGQRLANVSPFEILQFLGICWVVSPWQQGPGNVFNPSDGAAFSKHLVVRDQKHAGDGHTHTHTHIVKHQKGKVEVQMVHCVLLYPKNKPKTIIWAIKGSKPCFVSSSSTPCLSSASLSSSLLSDFSLFLLFDLLMINRFHVLPKEKHRPRLAHRSGKQFVYGVVPVRVVSEILPQHI